MSEVVTRAVSARRSLAGTANRNGSSNSGSVSTSGVGTGQRQHDDVERAAGQLFQQEFGLGFPQFDAQFRVAALQRRQDFRQHVGCERGDDAQGQCAHQGVAAVAGEIDEVASGRQNVLAPPHDLGADLCQHDLAGPALDQFDTQTLLKIANLHGQRRLGDRAGLRGAAEVPVLGQGIEIAELP